MSSKTETTATNEEETPALVPKLRFPEFREADGWTEMPLERAAMINPSNSGLPESFIYIDLESVEAGKLKAKNRISREGAPSRAQRLVEHGDIIYQVVRPYQRNNLLCEFDDNEDYVASTGYAQLRARGSNRFLYQSIHTESFVGRVIAKCTGSNYPAINSSDLAEIQLPIPPTPPEQQKIASCLSSLDELIAAQARKVDALKTHKKGMMQQLFPREGETTPRLRFPEFRDAGEWKPTTLGDITIKTDKRNKGSKSYPVYSISNKAGFVPQSEQFEGVDSEKRGYDISLYKIIERNTFAYNPARINVGSIGYSGNLHNIIISSLYVCFQTKNGVYDQFLQLFFETSGFQYSVNSKVEGGIRSYLFYENFAGIQVAIPSPAEQQKIASCLSSMDALLDAETQKFDALKTHKKGLMQQLFPSSKEAEV
jgi:type I restriction enzyme, S subunit